MKAIMKQNDQLFQVTNEPRVLLAMAFSMITREDCVQFIDHSGYL